MRTSIDQMIDLAKVFSSEMTVSRDSAENIMVKIPSVNSKEGNFSYSLVGRGSDVDSACVAYMREAKGKLLIKGLAGAPDRMEFVCV